MPLTPPRPRQPTTSIWASDAGRQRPARRADRNLPEHRDLWVLLFLGDHQLAEVLLHLPSAAEHARRVGQGAQRHQRHIAQRRLLEGEAERGLRRGEPSTPATTGPGASLAGRHRSRTTTTRPAACPATCQETDPSRKPGSSLCPWQPTTTISAVRLRSHSTRAADRRRARGGPGRVPAPTGRRAARGPGSPDRAAGPDRQELTRQGASRRRASRQGRSSASSRAPGLPWRPSAPPRRRRGPVIASHDSASHPSHGDPPCPA
jgi:hypothetical protein